MFTVILPIYDTFCTEAVLTSIPYDTNMIIMLKSGLKIDASKHKKAAIYETNQTIWEAYNTAAKLAKTKTIILHDQHIMHINSCLTHLMAPLEHFIHNIGIPIGFQDVENKFLNTKEDILKTLPPLNTRLPILMAINKTIFNEIGGFDENYQYLADMDLSVRLRSAGMVFVKTEARCVHLWHPSIVLDEDLLQVERMYFVKNEGIITRNKNDKNTH